MVVVGNIQDNYMDVVDLDDDSVEEDSPDTADDMKDMRLLNYYELEV